MVLDKKEMLYERLNAKDLDHQFQQRLKQGMGCSEFVSEAITNAVKEVYFPLLNSRENLKPGQILFQCLSKRNGSNASIKDAEQITVVLTLDDGRNDQKERKHKGVEGLRRHRIIRVCMETYNQGALLTVEDLAYRLFNVGERTIIRDLAAIRKTGDSPPLRSTVKDIGRTISHKVILIKSWLKGDELSDLHHKYNHSYSSIENYINTFKRAVFLQHEKYPVEQIAYMLKVSQSLAQGYLDLWRENKSRTLPHRKREILERIKKAKEKKARRKSL